MLKTPVYFKNNLKFKIRANNAWSAYSRFLKSEVLSNPPRWPPVSWDFTEKN